MPGPYVLDETKPLDTENLSAGAGEIRLTRAKLKGSFGEEHTFADGYHKDGTARINSGTFAARPAFGRLGRLYWATDTLEMYFDTGIAWTEIGGSRILNVQTDTLDIVNTAVEQGLWSWIVPAGALSISRALRLTLIGDYLNNTGANSSFTFRMLFGGLALSASLTQGGITAGDSRRALSFDIFLQAKGAANAQVAEMGFFLAWMGGIPGLWQVGTAPGYHRGVNNGLAVDSTITQILEIKVQHGTASPQLSVRRLSAMLELIR